MVIVGVLVVGAIFYPLPETSLEKEECSINSTQACDISCNADEDCIRFTYVFDFCFNKNELNNGLTGNTIKTMDNLTLLIKGCKCMDNKCQAI